MKWLAAPLLLVAGCLPVKGWTDRTNPRPKPAAVSPMFAEFARKVADNHDEAAAKVEAGELKTEADAREWLKDRGDATRNEAFRPIGEQIANDIGEEWTAERGAKAFRSAAKTIRGSNTR